MTQTPTETPTPTTAPAASASPAAPAATPASAAANDAASIEALADRLVHCYSGAVYDVMRSMGLSNGVLPNALRPLDPSRKVAGIAYTVAGKRRDGLSAHESLLAWTALLSRAPRNSVVVCQPHDTHLAHMGELSSEALHHRGIRGYIVDGGCRDSDFIFRLGFPVWCRYFTPVDIVGRWVADSFGESIEIGGVVIRTGDAILADRDGVIAIPQAKVAEVVDKVEEVMRTENKVRAAILQGTDPQEAYLLHGKF
ncbi:MAG: RraA family protein [Planctomycetota bacterium]|nr:RraA family protein [Planctomycetota bacterium]